MPALHAPSGVSFACSCVPLVCPGDTPCAGLCCMTGVVSTSDQVLVRQRVVGWWRVHVPDSLGHCDQQQRASQLPVRATRRHCVSGGALPRCLCVWCCLHTPEMVLLRLAYVLSSRAVLTACCGGPCRRGALHTGPPGCLNRMLLTTTPLLAPSCSPWVASRVHEVTRRARVRALRSYHTHMPPPARPFLPLLSLSC